MVRITTITSMKNMSPATVWGTPVTARMLDPSFTFTVVVSVALMAVTVPCTLMRNWSPGLRVLAGIEGMAGVVGKAIVPSVAAEGAYVVEGAVLA